MAEITLIYYMACLMFCLGYGVIDNYLENSGILTIVKTIITCFFAAPFLPFLFGIRMASLDEKG